MMEFQHSHASHCESGVMSSMLRHYGLPLSEAMSFGLSSALSFAYLPLIKINGLPLVAYRMPPKFIIKGLQKGRVERQCVLVYDPVSSRRSECSGSIDGNG